MSLIPWKGKNDPNRSLVSQFRSEMDRVFDRFLRDPWAGIEEMTPSRGEWAPTLDVQEDPERVTVRAELPGVDAKDVEVTLTKGTLLIAGEKREEHEEKRGRSYWSERRFGSFCREVHLPAEVDEKDVDAQYDNGVLTIRLRKLHAEPVRRVHIKVADKK